MRFSKKGILLFFVKILFLIFLLSFITFSYFLVLISSEETSFSFLTERVESEISKSLHSRDEIQIDNIRVEYKRFNIIAKLDNVSLSKDRLKVTIPEIELRFSIFDLMLFRNFPEDILIENLDVTYHIDSESSLAYDSNIEIHKILTAITGSDLEKITIDMISLKIFDDKDFSQNFLIEEFSSNVSSFFLRRNIMLTTKVIFDDEKVNLNSNCFTSGGKSSICNISLSKIDIKKISSLYGGLSFLSGVDLEISSNFTIESDINNYNKILFNFSSPKGKVDDKNIFSKIVNFKDLKISGIYDNEVKSLTLESFTADFEGGVKFLSSAKIYNIWGKKYDLEVKIDNLNRENLAKLWPNFIPEDDGVRSWVLKHIKSALITKSDVKMHFNKGSLEDIDAQFEFEKATILYDRYFPAIYNASGLASFNKKSMNIGVSSSHLMKTKLKNINITIDDFFKKIPNLRIKGLAFGRAEDLLKYVNYKSDFAKNIGNYLNGSAVSYIDLQIPIKNQINLSDLSFKSNITIKNLNNSYINDNSKLSININKAKNKSLFKTKIDLTDVNLNFDPLSIAKEKSIKSSITTNINIKDELLEFDDIQLKIKDYSLKGALLFDLRHKEVSNLNISHQNFNLSYNIDYKKSSREVLLVGRSFDFSKIKSAISSDQSGKKKIYKINNIEIILDKLHLLNDVVLNDVDINIYCNISVCINSFVELKKDDTLVAKIDFKPYPIKRKTKVIGKIHDVAILSKGLDISERVISGDLIIEAMLEMDDKDMVIAGEAHSKSGYEISKNEIVKRISKDESFLKLRDKLLLGDKIYFDELKFDFSMKNNIFELEDMVISNNYLGITANGKVNLSSGKVDIDGLVVPGYLINRLFGIGDLPVIKYVAPILIGEKGGGVFASKYQLTKDPEKDVEMKFNLNKSAIFAPGVIRNFFN